MKTIDQPSDDFNYNSVFQNGKQLAELLDVSPAAITSAVKKGHKCCGYPVAEWAEFSDSGRTKGYHVPNFLVEEGSDTTQKKKRPNPNPEPSLLNLAKINPELSEPDLKEGENVEQEKPSVTHGNNSVLPEGEDYVRPVTGLALSSTINSAVPYDTPQGRTVITAGVTGLGALTGHAVSDSPTGAAIGAGIGLGLSFLMIWLSEQNNEKTAQSSTQNYMSKEDLISEYVNKVNSSGFVN